MAELAVLIIVGTTKLVMIAIMAVAGLRNQGEVPKLTCGVEPLVREVVKVGGAMLRNPHSPPDACTPATATLFPQRQLDSQQDSLLSVPQFRALMVTMGSHGFVMVRRSVPGEEDSPLLQSQDGGDVVGLHFPKPSLPTGQIVSVSGAGDCLAAGFMHGLLRGLPLSQCAALGTAAAAASLQSSATVPTAVAAAPPLPPLRYTLYRAQALHTDFGTKPPIKGFPMDYRDKLANL